MNYRYYVNRRDQKYHINIEFLPCHLLPFRLCFSHGTHQILILTFIFIAVYSNYAPCANLISVAGTAFLTKSNSEKEKIYFQVMVHH